MNSTEIAKRILEADHDEFDPRDYVKSAKNRDNSVEIYNGPLVRVIQPMASFTANNYMVQGADFEWDAEFFNAVAKDGPVYIALDKADHDNMAIFQPSTSKVWNQRGQEVEWKELPGLISNKPESKFDDQDNKNWLDLQQGLATFFMAQIARKKDVGQWVKFLTMIGRTDLATNYARHLGRAKLPFGKSIDAVLAMKKAGKRSRNRIARLMKNQDDVKWGERGFWLLFNDWSDLAPFYRSGRNYDYAKNAEKIFNGDTFEWFENSNSKAEDVWGDINDANMSVIKQLLVNRTVYNAEGEEHLATQELVDELTDDEIKDIVCDRGNKGDSAEDIYRAVNWAANDAYASTMESAYYDGYRHALEKEWGLQEDKTIKWIGVGKREPDKKLGGGMVQQGDQKTMLGLYFPYATLEDWIKQWKDDEYEDDFYGDIHDLAKAYLPKVEPNDEYYGDTDAEYFNEQLAHHLSEIEPTAPEKVVDPAQPELPLQGEPDPQAREIERPMKVTIGTHADDQKTYKGVPQADATKYRAAMGGKAGGKDIYLQAEALLAHPFSYLEEVDPKAFVQNVPLFYVLKWEWEPGKFMYFGRNQGNGDASYVYDSNSALKFDSAEEAQTFLSSAQWGTPGWGVERPMSVTPINESDDEFLLGAGDKVIRNDDQRIEIEHDPQLNRWWQYDRLGDAYIYPVRRTTKGKYWCEVWYKGLNGKWKKGEFELPFDNWTPSEKPVFADGTVAEALTEAQVTLLEAIYKRSTTQIDLPKEIGQHVISWGELNIADADLYIDEKDGCGRETEQHVTVLYGLLDSTPPEALTEIVSRTKPFLIEFGGISIFENEKYDVIKLDVISEELHNLHMQIRRACQNDNKFPDYIPHCTVAYVKKGLGKKYAGQDVFKVAKVARDFWASDLLFKGAGDSEDGERVVQLIPFDKSKDFERDEPEAGEQRYPEAVKESEPFHGHTNYSCGHVSNCRCSGPHGSRDLNEACPLCKAKLAENLDPKAFLAAHLPSACPECHSHNISEEDEEGLVDCFDCGIWFDPLHPENQQVRESDEVDPKKFTERPGTNVDPHPDWQLIDREQDKNGRIKVLYRHKYGRVFFKLLNDFYGDDTPAYDGMLNDWWVYVYGGAKGDELMDGEDFQAGSFDEAVTTATNTAFALIHSSAPLLLRPRPPGPRPQQESDPVDPKAFIGTDKSHQLYDLYVARGERPVMKQVTQDNLNRYRHRLAREHGLSPRDIITLPSRVQEGELDPKAFALRTETPRRELLRKADSFPERNEYRRPLLGFQLISQDGSFPRDFSAQTVLGRQYLMDIMLDQPELADGTYDVFPVYDGEVQEPTILEGEEIDAKQFVTNHAEEWVIVADDPRREHPLLYLSNTGVQFVRSLDLARRFAWKEEADQVIGLIRSSLHSSVRKSLNAVKLPRLGEAEELNAKEFLDRATRYRIRMGVGAATRYIEKDSGTGQMFWHDFEEATVFTPQEAEAIIDQIGEVYGGQPVQAELAVDHHPDSHLGESDEVDPKAFVSNRKYLIFKKNKYDFDVLQRVGTTGINWSKDRKKGTLYTEQEAAEMVTDLQRYYNPTDADRAAAAPGAIIGQAAHPYKIWAEMVPHGVGESIGPFDEDGLPGEVTSFLRKVRSKRSKKKKQPII